MGPLQLFIVWVATLPTAFLVRQAGRTNFAPAAAAAAVAALALVSRSPERRRHRCSPRSGPRRHPRYPSSLPRSQRRSSQRWCAAAAGRQRGQRSNEQGKPGQGDVGCLMDASFRFVGLAGEFLDAIRAPRLRLRPPPGAWPVPTRIVLILYAAVSTCTDSPWAAR